MLNSVEYQPTSFYKHQSFWHRERVLRELVENNLSRVFRVICVKSQSSFSRCLSLPYSGLLLYRLLIQNKIILSKHIFKETAR